MIFPQVARKKEHLWPWLLVCGILLLTACAPAATPAPKPTPTVIPYVSPTVAPRPTPTPPAPGVPPPTAAPAATDSCPAETPRLNITKGSGPILEYLGLRPGIKATYEVATVTAGGRPQPRQTFTITYQNFLDFEQVTEFPTAKGPLTMKTRSRVTYCFDRDGYLRVPQMVTENTFTVGGKTEKGQLTQTFTPPAFYYARDLSGQTRVRVGDRLELPSVTVKTEGTHLVGVELIPAPMNTTTTTPAQSLDLLRKETITVPAGTFECLISRTTAGEATTQFWYMLSPPGLMVKMEQAAGSAKSITVLISFE